MWNTLPNYLDLQFKKFHNPLCSLTIHTAFPENNNLQQNQSCGLSAIKMMMLSPSHHLQSSQVLRNCKAQHKNELFRMCMQCKLTCPSAFWGERIFFEFCAFRWLETFLWRLFEVFCFVAVCRAAKKHVNELPNKRWRSLEAESVLPLLFSFSTTGRPATHYKNTETNN